MQMDMGETILEDEYRITRVPGGWIYRTEATQWSNDRNQDLIVGVSTVFVPFSAEPLVHP